MSWLALQFDGLQSLGRFVLAVDSAGIIRQASPRVRDLLESDPVGQPFDDVCGSASDPEAGQESLLQTE